MIRTMFTLLMFATAAQAQEPKKLLLLAQKADGHPVGTHEYRPGLKIVQTLLQKSSNLQVELVMADDPWKEGPELLKQADGVVLFLTQGAHWVRGEPKRLAAFQELAKRGGGCAVIHWGMGTKEDADIADFVALFGGCHGGPQRKYQVIPEAQVKLATSDHPVVRGLAPFQARDEFYYKLWFPKDRTGFTPLWQVVIDRTPETVAWAWQRPDRGRSFGLSGLHFHANWSEPEYRRLMVQGILWTMHRDIPAQGVNVEIRKKDLELP